ncbi:MAG: DEAD/DEAH box helicase [Myxococcales bacterium]
MIEPRTLEPVLAGAAEDAILSRFTDWVSAQGLTLYPHQEEALLELLASKHVVLSTPTGSGKSLVATFLHFQAMCRGQVSLYTCPTKALVNEKFFALCDAFGARNVGMITGDASINGEAPVLVCTEEVLSNLVERNPKLRADCVVMDEFHYYADRERGVAWQVPLLLLEKTQFLLMSATLGDTTPIEKKLEEVTRREVARVSGAQRPVPLEMSYVETPLHETLDTLVAANRAPIYLVNFSQRAAAERAQDLMSADFSSKEEKAKLKDVLREMGIRFDTPYGKDLQRFLQHGIGLHHAGLLPRYRFVVEKLAQQGLLKVVSGTDTLGVGVNVPIRTVVFTQLTKFDGEKTAQLTVRDFLQVAGRAGRKGFDDRGYVVAQAPEHVIENLKLEQKKQAGKKVVKKSPPAKGYVHWDRTTFERLTSKPPEPLESRFQVTHGMILYLLQAEAQSSARDTEGPQGYARLVQMVRRSHGNEGNKRIHLRTAAAGCRRLRAAGLVKLVRGNEYLAPHLEVAEHLQSDFSIHHTLALWLLDTLPRLDPTSDTYALDVLTLVESILENPMPVLWAQLDRAKGEKVAELKAQGVDYADRMEQLEKVEWPKPLREFVYDTFNAFADRHPWVGAEDVRPKSIARELFERGSSFDDYVREYGLQRSEGVLLRYLNDAYKTLLTSVPEGMRDETLDDVIAFLRTTVRTTDSTLLDEWEALLDPAASAEEKARRLAAAQAHRETLAARPRDTDSLLRDPRVLKARVRTELHRLLFALARRDFAAAAAGLRASSADSAWTPEELEAELAPALAALRSLDTTPRARRPDRTALLPDGPKRFRAQQKLLAPGRVESAVEAMARDSGATGEEMEAAASVDSAPREEWMLDCVVDLTVPRPEEEPLLELVRIGT